MFSGRVAEPIAIRPVDPRGVIRGRHYERTCNEWLRRHDAARDVIMPLFERTYGADAGRWFQRWRMFYMACAELFGYRDGNEWFVSHVLFQRPEGAGPG